MKNPEHKQLWKSSFAILAQVRPNKLIIHEYTINMFKSFQYIFDRYLLRHVVNIEISTMNPPIYM